MNVRNSLFSLLLLLNVTSDFAKQTVAPVALSSNAIVAEVGLSHKTGFINSYELMTSSAAGMEIRAKASSMEEKFHQELIKDEDGLKKAVDEYKAKAPLMSQAARVAEENRLKDLEESYKNKARRMQEELNAFLQEETTKLSMVIEGEIQSFAQKSGFDVIFDIATGRIVYCEQTLNKTSDLIALVNTKTETVAKSTNKQDDKKTA